MQACTR